MNRMDPSKAKNTFRRIIKLLLPKKERKLRFISPMNLIFVVVILFIISIPLSGFPTSNPTKPNKSTMSQENGDFTPTTGFQMELDITVQGNKFFGTLEETNDNIVTIVGQVGNMNSFNLTDQQRLNIVDQQYGSGMGTFLVFSDPSTIHGEGVILNCTYYAVVNTNGNLQGIWFFPKSTSIGGDGTFKLTPEQNKTEKITEFSSGIWKGQGTYNELLTEKSTDEETGVCYYDWKSEKTSKIDKYTAPQGYEYLIVTLYIRNDGDKSIGSYPWQWNLKANGIKYNYDILSTYSLNQGQQSYVDVDKGGETEIKIVYLIKEVDLSQADLVYMNKYINIQRINHY